MWFGAKEDTEGTTCFCWIVDIRFGVAESYLCRGEGGCECWDESFGCVGVHFYDFCEVLFFRSCEFELADGRVEGNYGIFRS